MDGVGGTDASAVERVRSLAPIVAAWRGDLDIQRQLPQPVIQGLIERDLLRLWAPPEIGGGGLPARELVDVVEEAAALDGAVGWTITNAAVASRLAGNLPQAVAARLFGPPNALCATSTAAIGSAAAVEGGYRVTGRWPNCSSLHHATSVMVLCAEAASDSVAEPQPICCHIDANAGSIVDEWHVSGLRGTGSCDFVLEGAFVPHDQCHAFIDDEPLASGALYRLPILTLLPLSVGIVPLGLARAALEEFSAIATWRRRSGSSAPLAEREWVQYEIGRAEARRRAARALILDAVTTLEAALDGPPEALRAARLFLRPALTQAAELCHAAVDAVARCAGMAAIQEAHRLERIVRDLDAAMKHVAVSPNGYVLGGRAALGQSPGTNRF